MSKTYQQVPCPMCSEPLLKFFLDGHDVVYVHEHRAEHCRQTASVALDLHGPPLKQKEHQAHELTRRIEATD